MHLLKIVSKIVTGCRFLTDSIFVQYGTLYLCNNIIYAKSVHANAILCHVLTITRIPELAVVAKQFNALFQIQVGALLKTEVQIPLETEIIPANELCKNLAMVPTLPKDYNIDCSELEGRGYKLLIKEDPNQGV